MFKNSGKLNRRSILHGGAAAITFAVSAGVGLAGALADEMAELVKKAQAEGELTIYYALADEPAIASPFGVGIVAKARHPNAARLFQEWATGAEAQSRLSSLVQIASANQNAKDTSQMSAVPWFEGPKKLYVEWSTPEVLGQQAEFNERWNRTFNYVQ